VVWETVSDESKLTLLSILLNWVEVIFLVDLFYLNFLLLLLFLNKQI